MTTYTVLSTLTAEGRRTLRENAGRTQEAVKEIEAFGVKALSGYVTLGPIDFVNILEAPDNKMVMKVSVELAAIGTLEFTTLPTMPVTEVRILRDGRS